ncbi:YpiF family protein [Lederbergia citrea]|uniref:YpiF family protein n=1 Tax=Lederbergia citrea TaxID=2833581 RepID=A0A942Z4V3_9BACI|nr:YpiF family protein [Lederbergia citrea]MBS4203132.1 YpiF family protein [Lederbergia citrea]MBS4222196.1 YpiF family protein [Lederbergia citrea]
MNWNAKDVQVYLEEREYIDTIVIPLLPVAFDDSMKRAAEQGEFTQLLSLHLERQFKGRMLVLPPYTYMEEPANIELDKWEAKAKESGFSHVFFLTSDKRWKTVSEERKGTIFYVPSIPLEHMDEQYKQSVMEDQLKNLMSDIIRGWQQNE